MPKNPGSRASTADVLNQSVNQLKSPLARAVAKAAWQEFEEAVAKRTWQAVESWFPPAQDGQESVNVKQLRLHKSKVSRWKKHGRLSLESLIHVLLMAPHGDSRGRDWTELYFENEARDVVLDFPKLTNLQPAIIKAYRRAIQKAQGQVEGASGPTDLQILALLLMFDHRENDDKLDYAWALPLRPGASEDAKKLNRVGIEIVYPEGSIPDKIMPDELQKIACQAIKVARDDWGEPALRAFRVLKHYMNVP